nr:cold shock domain-containing protein [Cellulosimicrobium aquatile]
MPLGAQAAQPAADGADGTVSWYDDVKGFGFVAPDGGGDDVFVHVSALGRGLTELAEGARVTYDVVEGDKGPNARNVQLVGGSGRPGPDRGRPGSDRGRPGSDRGRPASGGRVRGGEGTVARYDADRGFGFITPDAGGEDLFVHVSVVRGGEELEQGDRVRFKIRQSDRGPQADGVELI